MYENTDKPKAPIYTLKQFICSISTLFKRGSQAKSEEEQAYEAVSLLLLATVVLSLLMSWAVIFGICDFAKIHFGNVLWETSVFIVVWSFFFYCFYRCYKGIMKQPYIPRSQVKIKKYHIMVFFALTILIISEVFLDYFHTKSKAFYEQKYLNIVAPCILPQNVGKSCCNEVIVYLTKENAVIDTAQIELTKDRKYKLTVDLNKQRVISPPAVSLERVSVRQIRPDGKNCLVTELSRPAPVPPASTPPAK